MEAAQVVMDQVCMSQDGINLVLAEMDQRLKVAQNQDQAAKIE